MIILIALLLLISPALAQTDQYWQQVCAAKDSQANQMMVGLLKQLDDANKHIADLQKEIDGLKGEKK